MFGWFRKRREFRQRVSAEADRLQQEHGFEAYARASIAARSPNDDYEFRYAVRNEVARRIGHQPGLDNATRRFMEGHG